MCIFTNVFTVFRTHAHLLQWSMGHEVLLHNEDDKCVFFLPLCKEKITLNIMMKDRYGV